MTRLVLRTLVPVPVLTDEAGRQLLGPSKQLALLVYLAMRGTRGATREEVIARMSSPDQADPRASLRQLLRELRRRGVPVGGTEHLRVHSGIEFDVDAFRATVARGCLGDALAIYSHDFLGSWLPGDMPELVDWIEGERRQLAEERRGVLLALGRGALEAHQPADALSWAEQLLTVESEDVDARDLRERAAALVDAAAVPSAVAQARHHAVPGTLAPARRLPVLLAAGLVLAAGVVLVSRGRAAPGLPDVHTIVLTAGSPNSPTSAGVVRADGGRIHFVADPTWPAELRLPRRWWNSTRTEVARPCALMADRIPLCLGTPSALARALSELQEAQAQGWTDDDGLLVLEGRRRDDSYDRSLIYVDPRGRAEALPVGRLVREGWPDPTGRLVLAAVSDEAGREHLVLVDRVRRETSHIAWCPKHAYAAWSPDGSVAVACERGRSILTGRLAVGAPWRRRELPAAAAGPLDFSPDGQLIAVMLEGARRRLALLDDRVVRAVIEVPGMEAVSGWYETADTVVLRLILDERFDAPDLDRARWKAFGDPAPVVLSGRGVVGGAFFNRGDDQHGSGIALRTPLPLAGGLTVQAWVRVPITRKLWQSASVCLRREPADSFRLGKGPPVLSENGQVPLCAEFPNPHDPSGASQMEVSFGDRVPAVVLPEYLRDGQWHLWRVLLEPDGAAWLTADGVRIAGPVRVDLSALPSATLVIEGRSVGTQVLVDDVRVWTGVVVPPAVRR